MFVLILLRHAKGSFASTGFHHQGKSCACNLPGQSFPRDSMRAFGSRGKIVQRKLRKYEKISPKIQKNRKGLRKLRKIKNC
jgi:hypothetical protein